MKLLRSLMVLTALTSCATSYQLNDQAKSIDIMKRPNKSKDCHLVGKVKGEHSEGSRLMARNQAQNKAGKLNATHIYFAEEISNGSHWTILANAFQCE